MQPSSLYSVKNVAQDNNQTNSVVVDYLFDTAKQYGVSKCEKSLTRSFILAIFAGVIK
jgi:hypothetical protein